ncbi:hypothetical protein JTB14_012111 [Gonioctena quinquepunctata]|nr:hypothetical protein JTB14_012111 [Gonioctena quinquepunctata]
MSECNNAAHCVEENPQRISNIDNQLNFTEGFTAGYVEDMMVDDVQPNMMMMIYEGVDYDISNEVMVRRTTSPISQMDGRTCYIVSLVEVRVFWSDISMYMVLPQISDDV